MFVSNESNQYEVYAAPFPGPGTRVQISPSGGRWARWRSNTELLYLKPDGMLVSVIVERGAAGIRVVSARDLFRPKFRPSPRLDAFLYDIAPDGRLLVNTDVEDVTAMPLTLVINWPAAIGR